MKRIFLLLLLPAGIPFSLPAQPDGNGLNLPPSSESSPERIKIPITEVLDGSAVESEEQRANEQAALDIAAAAQGYVPPGSSGILRKGMMVRVTVMVQGQMEVSPEPQRINKSGEIGLPLVKRVRVGDQSIDDLEDMLTEHYSEFYVDPLVNVEFVGAEKDPSMSPWGYVTVIGEVGSAGPIAMPPTGNLTVIGAIKQAGGAPDSAKISSVRIYRPIPEERSVERIKVNLDDLGKEGGSRDYVLRAGDVILVPQRIF